MYNDVVFTLMMSIYSVDGGQNNWPIFIDTSWFTVMFILLTSYKMISLLREDPEQFREVFKLLLNPIHVNVPVIGIGWNDDMSRYHFKDAGNVITMFDPCLIIF